MLLTVRLVSDFGLVKFLSVFSNFSLCLEVTPMSIFAQSGGLLEMLNFAQVAKALSFFKVQDFARET